MRGSLRRGKDSYSVLPREEYYSVLLTLIKKTYIYVKKLNHISAFRVSIH